MCSLTRQFGITLNPIHLPVCFSREMEHGFESVYLEMVSWSYNQNLLFACASAGLWRVVAGSSLDSPVWLNYCPKQQSGCPQKLKARSDLLQPGSCARAQGRLCFVPSRA